MSEYTVTKIQAQPRTLAAVRARIPLGQVSAHIREMLGKVYAAGLQLDGQNVAVYRPSGDKMLDVEFGVGLKGPFAPNGDVVRVETPSGMVATTTHVGDYGKMGQAHDAVKQWCKQQGLALAGPSWEVYGHMIKGVPPRTDVYWLLEIA